MSEETSELELEQMRKFATFKSVALIILRKWLWLMIFVFIMLSVVFSMYVMNRYSNSISRYTATTQLMFKPRSTNKVQAMNEKHLFGILNRASLKRKVGNYVELSSMEKMCLTQDLRIKQEKQQNTFFTLTALAASHQRAVEKVNTYADILIEEYRTFRINDLREWAATIEERKKVLMDQIAEADTEEKLAKSKNGITTSPTETLSQIKSLISDQRHNQSKVHLKIASEENTKKRLEAEVGQMDKKILECSQLIRKKSEELAAIDDELAKLREKYTDQNPKVQGKIDDRKALTDDYIAMLKENGIENATIQEVERVEHAVMELAEVTQRIETLSENSRSIENEIRANEEKCAALEKTISVIGRINEKRNEIERTLRDLSERHEEIEFFIMTTPSELFQLEVAGGANDKEPLSIKNLLLAIFGSLICTISLSFWILLLEMFYGRVRNSRELAAYGDIIVLGSLPKPGVMGDEKEREVLQVVTLNFTSANIPKNIVLVCRLPGARHLSRFSQALEWSLSMAGQRIFMMDITSNLNFEPPEDSESLTNVVRKDSRGWFPCASRYALAPAEIMMFKTDLATLREEFDNVFIFMPDGVRHGGNFFHQVLEICDSALLELGANTTPRSELRYVRKQTIKAGKPMMGLISDAPKGDVRREMELKND